MNPFLKIGILAILLFLFTLCAFAADVITTDLNSDGQPDGWTYVVNGRIEKQEIDVNYDGMIDGVFIYESSGEVKEEILDTNYDGKMDNWRLYQNGQLVVDGVDRDMDGMIDMWIHVVKGKIVQIEKDTDGDGRPDKFLDY